MLQRAWNSWKKFARAIGNFQARVFLSVFYGLLLLPFGLVARLFADPLKIKRRPTEWTEYPAEAYDVQWARRQ